MAKSARTKSGSWKFDADAAIRGLETLRDNVHDILRPALYDAVKIMYDQTVLNAAAISPGKGGSGRLARSIYHVFSQDNSGPNKVSYQISWNKTNKAKAAYHAHFLEFGFTRRYQAIQLKNGDWITLRSAEARKNNWVKPGRNSSQAEKDKYWMRREKGVVFEQGHYFLRNAYSSSFQRAAAAFREALPRELDRILRGG